MFRLSGIGLNPNTVLFRDEAAGVDTPDNPDESDEMAACADKVFDYVPAPTQYMNTVTTAYTDGFTTKQQVLDYAAERLRKKSLLSLGAYGGYIVLGFSQPYQMFRENTILKFTVMPTIIRTLGRTVLVVVQNRVLY